VELKFVGNADKDILQNVITNQEDYSMTPDEVVKVLKKINKEVRNTEGDTFELMERNNTLETAISLIQDYQKMKKFGIYR